MVLHIYFTKVDTRSKLIFTVSESAVTSWMFIFDGILDDFVD